MLNSIKERVLSGEDGFTIVEILVAAIILVVGSLAVFMSLASSIHGIQRSKEIQQGITVAQREMERVRAEPFSSIGLSAAPVRSTETTSPLNRVSSGGNEFNVNRSGTAKNLPLITSGSLAGKTEGVRSPDGTTATVYRFVVCEEAIGAECRSKRIILDVQTIPTKMQAKYMHAYYELQSTVTKTGG